MHPSVYNFNKEILFGESGALILANVTAPIVAHFTQNNNIISVSALLSTLIGGSLFWLTTRIYHHKKKDSDFKVSKIKSDISYFTPAAFIFGLVVYDPAIYFISNYLLNSHYTVGISVITGQVIAFSLFLICMNLYRLFLKKYKIKHL